MRKNNFTGQRLEITISSKRQNVTNEFGTIERESFLSDFLNWLVTLPTFQDV